MLILSKLIKMAYEQNGVITAYIFNDFGFGKTSYAMWVAYQIYGNWDDVLKYLCFDPEEAIQHFRNVIKTKKRIPVIIMDDAGLWLDKQTWWEPSKIAFYKFFNLIRSLVGGILFTSASDDLPKPIRKKCFFRIRVEPIDDADGIITEDMRKLCRKFKINDKLWCRARGYKLKTLPNFLQFTETEFDDYYPMHYPIYEKYEKKRFRALEKAFKRWEEEATKKGVAERKGLALKEVARVLLSCKKLDWHDVIDILTQLGAAKGTAYNYVREFREQLCSTYTRSYISVDK